MGLALHLSEIISDVVEPMVGGLKGREVISTEDMIARAEKENSKNENWTPTSWWENKVDGNFTTCGTCVGKSDYVFEEGTPELCNCEKKTSPNKLGLSCAKLRASFILPGCYLIFV